MTQTFNEWHHRYLGLAALVATWSKDPSTRVGAVLVRPDRSVASLGFNGLPKGVHDDDEVLANRAWKYERVVHAEMKAILLANESVKGYTLYVTTEPCNRCAAHIIQAGITRVICPAEPTERAQGRAGQVHWHRVVMFEQVGVEFLRV